MLALTGSAASNPATNLFFAAAHYLLLGGATHPVAEYDPSLTDSPKTDDPYPACRSFCLEHADRMREGLATRRVPTYKVRRCVLLLPAFGLVAERAEKLLYLVEAGTRAGLYLLVDRYAYDYGENRVAGDPDSPACISCEPRGGWRGSSVIANARSGFTRRDQPARRARPRVRGTELKLSTFDGKMERETILARCDDHGEWIQWVATLP